jgi:hypothetical protein
MVLMWAALAITFLITCAAITYAFKAKQSCVELQQQLDRQVKDLQRELSAINSAAMGVGRQLMTVEKKLAKSIEQQQQLELTTTNYLPYKQAVELVEKGADASALMDQCGLPAAEANLMSLVQGAGRS